MKQRVINGNALEFFDSSNTKKGEIKISGSDIIINPLDGNGTVIFGEEGTVNDIEVGAVGTPVDFTFAGGGTLASNGGTLTIGNAGDTIDLSNASIGAITASAFVGGTFEGDGSGLTGVIPDLTSYNGNVGITGSLVVSGRVTAEEFHTEFVSSSIIYQSGSTKFGDTNDDIHSFTGSLKVTNGTAGDGLLLQQTAANTYQLTGLGIGSIWTAGPTNRIYFNQEFHSDFRGGSFDSTNIGSPYALKVGASGLVVQSGSYNVGIGTDAPQSLLHLSGKGGSSRITAHLGDTNGDTSDVKLLFSRLNAGASSKAGYQIPETNSAIHTWIEGGHPNSEYNVTLAHYGKAYFERFSDSSATKAFGFITGAGNSSVTGASSYSASMEMYVDGNMALGLNGNVGIGTTNPAAKLDVDGVTMLRTEADMWQSEEKFLRIGRFGRTTGITDRNHYLTAKVSDGASNNFISFNIDDGSTSTGSSHATDLLKLRGDGVATFNGNVGIGTSTPAGQLEVNDNIYIRETNGSPFLALTNQSAGAVGTPFYVQYDSTFGTIYSANPLRFYAGGDRALDILANGNVGIGTTAPQTILEVSNASPEIGFHDTGAGDRGSIHFQDGTFEIYTNTTTAGKPSVNGTRVVTIEKGGNVGIGTSSPGAKLDISTPASATSRIDVFNSLHVSNNTLKISHFGASHVSASRVNQIAALNSEQHLHLVTDSLANVDAGTSTKGIMIRSGGNVGIGTTSPAYKLDVAGTISNNSEQNFIYSTYDDVGALFQRVGTFGAVIRIGRKGVSNSTTIDYPADGTFAVSTAGSEKMRITSAGNVGIGNTTPVNRLDVTGAASVTLLRVGSSASGEGIIRHTANGNGIGIATGAVDSTGIGLFVSHPNNSRNVGIGTTSPSAKLHVSGAADVMLIEGSGSTANTSIFAIDGNNGRLFEVSDDLSDSLFSVNTVAGLPVVEVFADNRVTMGAFNQNDFVISGSRVGIGTDLVGNTRGNLIVQGDFQDNLSGNGQLAVIGNVSGSNPSGSGNGGQIVLGGSISDTDGQRTFASIGGHKEDDTSGDRAGYLSFGTRQNESPKDIFERMRITSTGNVGIGTTSPDTLLHLSDPSGNAVIRLERNDTTINTGDIYGAIEFEGQDSNFGANGVRGSIQGVSESTLGSMSLVFSTAPMEWVNQEVMRIDSNGRVGIGTTNPGAYYGASKLVVDIGSSEGGITIAGGTSSTGALYFADGTSVSARTRGSLQYSHIVDAMYLTTAGSTRMTISSAGNVGIGTTSPAEKFHVSGSVRVDGAGTGTVQEQAGSSPTTAYTNGDTSFYMGQPDTYLKIVIDGTTYVIPAYIPA